MEILTYGNPTLRARAEDVIEIAGDFARTCEYMYEAMLQAKGIGLAASQVGIQQRFFVYDPQLFKDRTTPSGTPQVLINPQILEADGEWEYEEACLSVPGLAWNIVRPKELLVRAMNYDGEETTFEADELFARLIQHEIDHMNGQLLIDLLDEDEKRAAKKQLRQSLQKKNRLLA